MQRRKIITIIPLIRIIMIIFAKAPIVANNLKEPPCVYAWVTAFFASIPYTMRRKDTEAERENRGLSN